MNMPAKIIENVLHRSQYALNDVRGMLGRNRPLFSQARGARIIVYHGICRNDPTRFNSIFLRVKSFEQHLRFYKKYFNIVSLDDYYNQRFSNDRFNVCITFDDGFANNYKYVLPLMIKYKAPVSFFITAIREAGYAFLWNDFLSMLQKYGPGELSFENDTYYKNRHRQYLSKTGGPTLRDLLQNAGFEKKAAFIKHTGAVLSPESRQQDIDYWMQMNEEEIKAIALCPLAGIGCHGYYHNDLARIAPEAAKNELTRSKQYLETITQREMDAIAFPYGSYNPALVADAKQAGFKQLLVSELLYPGDAADTAIRPRFTVNPYISVNNQMSAIINGRYIS